MRHSFDSVDRVPLPEKERRVTQETINGFVQTVKSEIVISMED